MPPLGLISGDDDANAVDLKRINGERASAVSGCLRSQQDRNRLMGACAADLAPVGVRDAAILALAATSGARRAETSWPLTRATPSRFGARATKRGPPI